MVEVIIIIEVVAIEVVAIEFVAIEVVVGKSTVVDTFIVAFTLKSPAEAFYKVGPARFHL